MPPLFESSCDVDVADRADLTMAFWRVREFHGDDLDAVIRLWDDPAASDSEPVFTLSELVAAVRADEPAVVATVGDEVVGCAVAEVDKERAWLLRVSLSPQWRQRGIGSALLGALEERLVAAGVHRISCLLSSGAEIGAAALEHQGYRSRAGVAFFEKIESAVSADLGLLGALGGRLLRADLWDQLKGMVREKELIEQRIVLPLAHDELAARAGLRPPRAVVLFGPPGTGKTSFAKAIASRLGWPFVELFPSRLAGESPAGLAAALREGAAPSTTQGVTNEMLKLIPTFREREGRLLVCATNSVRALDAAFLRHGRFDYVIPVGPPDAGAREAVWRRYLSDVPHEELDWAAIVERSELLTPADIEFAARRAAQLVFERSVAGDLDAMVVTADIIACIASTRPTLTRQMIDEFEADIEEYARL